MRTERTYIYFRRVKKTTVKYFKSRVKERIGKEGDNRGRAENENA
jgi:hypothetical protein